MTAVDRRFFAEVLGAGALVLAVLGSAVLFLEAVELGRWIGAVGLVAWMAEVGSRVPARLVAVAPVAAALGAVVVGLRWQRAGHLEALAAMGSTPVRPGLAAAAAALVLAGGAAAVRDGLAPRADVDGAWVSWDRDGETVHVKARSLAGRTAVDVDAVRVSGGLVTARGHVDVARWDGHGWDSTGEAVAWTADGARTAGVALPSPREWRALAAAPGPDTPLPALFRAPRSPARAVWLAERPATPLGAALLGWIAVAMAWLRPRHAYPAVLALAVTWRVAQAGALAVAARGGWAAAWGTVAPLMVLAVVAAALWVLVERPTAR